MPSLVHRAAIFIPGGKRGRNASGLDPIPFAKFGYRNWPDMRWRNLAFINESAFHQFDPLQKAASCFGCYFFAHLYRLS